MRASFVSAFLVALVGSAQAEQTTAPTAFPADRYAKMREKSPFALATPPVAAAAPAQAPFTQNLVLSGLSMEVNEKGEDVLWALITSRDRKEQFSLEGDKPSADGISIASLEKSPKIKLMLRKGNELGSVEYDEAAVAPQAPPAPPANGRPAQANQPGQPPRATNRIQIPRPNVAPQVNVAPGAPAPAPSPAAGNIGRRVRVIQSRPAQ